MGFPMCIHKTILRSGLLLGFSIQLASAAATLTGFIRNSNNGQPINKAMAYVYERVFTGSTTRLVLLDSSQSDAQDRYHLDSLPGYACDVRFKAAGYKDTTYMYSLYAPNSELKLDMNLKAVSTSIRADRKMRLGSFALDGNATLRRGYLASGALVMRAENGPANVVFPGNFPSRAP